jgi:uncharacterized protein (DUF1778 family)
MAQQRKRRICAYFTEKEKVAVEKAARSVRESASTFVAKAAIHKAKETGHLKP